MYKAIHNVLQMQYKCITIAIHMKIAKTFRLSEEAIKVINQQTNATEFLEDLILDKYQRPMEVVPLQQLKDLLDGLSSNGRTEAFEALNLGSSHSEPAITPQSILAEIEDKKQRLSELIEVNQDPADHAKLQNEIQELWRKYSILKELDNTKH